MDKTILREAVIRKQKRDALFDAVELFKGSSDPNVRAVIAKIESQFGAFNGLCENS